MGEGLGFRPAQPGSKLYFKLLLDFANPQGTQRCVLAAHEAVMDSRVQNLCLAFHLSAGLGTGVCV